MGRSRAHDTEPPQARLSDGTLARIVPSEFPPGMELYIGQTPQSHVDLADPTHLRYEYVARIGAVIDGIGMPGQPLTAVHLGAGAMTLPRYVAATRPGSRQQVIEKEQALVDLVRAQLPLPRDASIRVRIGDAREGLARLPHGLVGAVDLVVVDVFAGARTPAHLTSREFFAEASALLRPSGVLTANVADGAGLPFARREAATLRAVLPEVIVLTEAQTFKGRRFGNLVLAGSQRPFDAHALARLLAAGPFPAKVAHGAELDAFCGTLPPLTDATARPSPLPSSRLFER